ncbi:MAG TPA: ABC transporter substrate-binding protein [Acidimicrobiales bacterium]
MSEPLDRRTFLARSIRTAGGLALLGGASGALAACGLGPQSSSASSAGVSQGTPRRGGTLTFATEAEIEGFDPTRELWGVGGLLSSRAVYDTLAAVDASGAVRPYLAQSITANADYTRWTITLRRDVAFHDGSPLTAAAVKTNLDALRTAPLTAPALATIGAVDVIDPMNVVVSMRTPWQPFPFHLTGQAGIVVEPRTLLAGDADHKPVGTGPFVFERWTPGDTFTATRNPSYWRPGLPYLDKVRYEPIIDQRSREDTFTSGQVDMMHSSDTQNISNLRGDPSWVTIDDAHASTEPDMDFVLLNTAVPPTDDSRLRMALAHAIDKQRIIDKVRNGIPPKSFGPFARGSPYHSSTGYPWFDVDTAKALVARYQQDKGPVSVELVTDSTSKGRQIGRLLRGMWEKVGIQCQVIQVDAAQLAPRVRQGSFQTCTWRQFAAADPDLNYASWTADTAAPVGQPALNLARNRSPQIQQALETGRSSGDAAARTAAYRSLARTFASELPYLWTNRGIWMVAAQRQVQNFAGATLPGGGKAKAMSRGVVTPTEIWLNRS